MPISELVSSLGLIVSNPLMNKWASQIGAGRNGREQEDENGSAAETTGNRAAYNGWVGGLSYSQVCEECYSPMEANNTKEGSGRPNHNRPIFVRL